MIKDTVVFLWVLGSLFLLLFGNWIEVNHPDNNSPVAQLVTPAHIVPEWYFLSYYSVLKVVPSKNAGLGVLGMVLVSLAWLLESVPMPVSSAITSTLSSIGWSILILWGFWWFLTSIGAQLPTSMYVLYGRFGTFAILVLMAVSGNCAWKYYHRVQPITVSVRRIITHFLSAV